MNGELPVGRWERAIAARVSRRRYLPRAPDPSLLQRLEDHCARFRPLGAARALPVSPCPPNLFRGIVGSYGSIRGAPCCLVFVGPAGSEAQVGYVGEAAVLEATVLGLGTCWVGGLFRPDSLGDRVALGPGERVWAVAAVGLPVERKTLEERLMAGIARSHKRKPAETLAPGIGSWPAWAARAVTAARLAPSALNRQPWRFRREGETRSCVPTAPTPTPSPNAWTAASPSSTRSSGLGPPVGRGAGSCCRPPGWRPSGTRPRRKSGGTGHRPRSPALAVPCPVTLAGRGEGRALRSCRSLLPWGSHGEARLVSAFEQDEF
jgi:hypothetical protein